MQRIEVSALTQPIDPRDPAGPDLEFDAAFVALEEALRAKPEQQFGDTIIAAQEPDWGEVRNQAVAVLERSKDLRAAVHLVQALVQGHGLSGLAQGLELVRALLADFWETLHPQLDPDDDLDPTLRVNTLASLCDPGRILKPVRNAAMVRVPGLGGISLRAVQLAKGQLPPPEGEEILKLDSIDAAIRDTEEPRLREAETLVAGALSDLAAIEQILLDRVGVGHAIGLEALATILREILAFLREQLAERGGGEDAESGEQGMAGGPATAARVPRVAGEIASSQDVIDTLNQIIAYYKAREPSSPIPLLLERARRLVSADFFAILRDIAPDGLDQAEQATGARTETDD